MIASFSLLFGNRSLRVLAFILLLTGFTIAATQPYVSVVGIHELGMSNTILSVFLFLFALANLTVGITISIYSDIVANHRRMFLLTSAAWPCRIRNDLSVSVDCCVPDLQRHPHPDQQCCQWSRIHDFAQKNQRTRFQADWHNHHLCPDHSLRRLDPHSRSVGLLLVNSSSMLGAWGVSALAALASLMLSTFAMSNENNKPFSDSQNVTFFSSLKMIVHPAVLAQVVCMAMVMGSHRLATILAPLILLGSAHGKMTDIGFLAGAVAFLEIPFMLMWGALLRKTSTLLVLSLGTACFCLYLLLLGFATEPWQFYALLLPNGCGAAAILSLPMVYFQDLLRDRPGLGTSLYQSNVFVANGISAGTFALGSSFLTDSQTVWLGLGLAAGGILGLYWLQKRQHLLKN